ncbi:hypothetical protein HUT13_18565 [Streptomyces harbinensis]|uniref:hypothetical protein n=1 Tax=Streptomyces harbinensis TaxID=1176198 RepID=UPI001592105B|nr:hypothetical protein [Streptomyces harbinensis]QKV70551.1 hypothetical protein HUT13_18565 [Streptomyces harbinensis]
MRAPADPVRVLMHRHRELCERATDPLEIAAALEAHGVTDSTAARFRHRDVFSLAEELYARTPRPGEAAEGPARPHGTTPARAPLAPPGTARHRAPARRRRLPRRLLTPLPAALVSAGMAVPGPLQAALTAAAVLAGGVLLYRPGRARLAALCALPLVALLWYRAGPGALLPPAVAVVPAVWCRDWFAARSRRRLAGSRSLREFAGGARALLAGSLLLFTAGLAATQAALWPLLPPAAAGWAVTAQTTALGVLLFESVLLAAHGFHRAAAAGPAVAGALHLLLVALPGAPPALHAAASGATAAVLLVPASRALAGAFAHHGPPPRTH